MCVHNLVMNVKIIFLASAVICAASAAPENRIVGGTPIEIQQAPAVVSMVYHYPRINLYIQRCTGALISSWHVATTAFCFTGASLVNFHIRAGSTNSLSGGQIAGIRQVIQHPDFVAEPRQADLAIVIMSQPLSITPSVNILFIPPSGTFLPVGLRAVVAGWGFETDDGPQHETLRSITLNKISLEQCRQSFQGEEGVNINDAVICAAAEGVGTCFGDSGAPMIYQNILIGISSFYKECGNSDYPDVFTRIDRFTDWIMQVAVAPTGDAPLRKTVF